MYKLLAAAQAIKFSVGCHARCSNLAVWSKVLPFPSHPGLSAPVFQICKVFIFNYLRGIC